MYAKIIYFGISIEQGKKPQFISPTLRIPYSNLKLIFKGLDPKIQHRVHARIEDEL
jgi:hypothetical protein